MKAMIFAAGLGTRLRPLTDNTPKALVPVGNKPLLQWIIEKIIRTGCLKIVVNVHHFSEQIRAFLAKNNNFGITIHISDESDAILDTGGGLLKAAGFLKGTEPVLIHNVDIISNMDLGSLLDYHLSGKSLATLAVRHRETERYLLFNRNMRLTGWTNKATGEIRKAIPEMIPDSTPFAFSGIQIINPEFLNLMTGSGKFSLIDTCLQLTMQYPILGYEDHSSVWIDVGKPEHLAEAEKLFSGENLFFEPQKTH
jgi:NDP-sugar pyrophosphorylase family protein